MQPEMTLRDTFAAAALTGLLASDQYDQLVIPADYAGTAYELADAMLRERAKTIHDAAPAARAADMSVESVAPQPTAHPHGTGDSQARFHSAVMNWISEATVAIPAEHPNSRRIMADACAECWDAFNRIAYPTATHSASACDGVDVLPDAGSGGPINHSAPACQPPVASRGSEESERRDVARPDTKGKVAGGPAHNTQEPVAWAVVRPDDEVTVVAFMLSDARDLAAGSDRVVPLYRQPQPTLTDAEREAISCAAVAYAARSDRSVSAATLRGLLERLK